MGRMGLCPSRWGCVQGRPKQAQALISSQAIWSAWGAWGCVQGRPKQAQALISRQVSQALPDSLSKY
eukprot:1160002-Pelagomonas_calceolata.AAC.17